MPKVALDFDGVLANSMQAWLNLYNDRYKKTPNVFIDEITSWDFEHKLGITTHEKMTLFREVWQNWSIIKAIEPYQHRRTRSLSAWCKVDIVTTIPPEYVNFAGNWCMRNDISFNKIISVDKDGKEKAEYDYFIDDNPQMAMRMDKQPNKILFLYDQWWNKNIPNTNNVIRVKDLREVEDYIIDEIQFRNDLRRIDPKPIPNDKEEDELPDDYDDDWSDDDDSDGGDDD